MTDFLEIWRDLTWLGRFVYAAVIAGSFATLAFVLYVFILGIAAL